MLREMRVEVEKVLTQMDVERAISITQGKGGEVGTVSGRSTLGPKIATLAGLAAYACVYRNKIGIIGRVAKAGCGLLVQRWRVSRKGSDEKDVLEEQAGIKKWAEGAEKEESIEGSTAGDFESVSEPEDGDGL